MKELQTRNRKLLPPIPHSFFWFRENLKPLSCSFYGILFNQIVEASNNAFLLGHLLLTLTPASNYFSDTVHFAVFWSEVASLFSSYTSSSFDSTIPENTEKLIVEDSEEQPTHM